jgi:hypothetical protein
MNFLILLPQDAKSHGRHILRSPTSESRIQGLRYCKVKVSGATPFEYPVSSPDGGGYV